MKKIFSCSTSALILALAAVAARAQAAGEVVWDGRDVYMMLSRANADKAPVDECKTGTKAPARVVVTISPKDSSEPIVLKLDFSGCALEEGRDAVEGDPLLVVRKYNSRKVALLVTGTQRQDKSAVFLSLGDGRFLYVTPKGGHEAIIENAKLVSGQTIDLGTVYLSGGYEQKIKGRWFGEATATLRSE
jgi:hypothetical protein